LPHSPKFLADIGRTISRQRLTRYLNAAGNDIERALDLYEKNLALSESMFGFLHGLEVAVRNSLHQTLSCDLGVEDWFQDGFTVSGKAIPALTFNAPMLDMIWEARKTAGIHAPIGKVIAELSFGFWSNLTAKRYDRLWRASLHKAFPNARVRRGIIHWRLETIRRLRNRIAHHEPILSSRNVMYTGYSGQPVISLIEINECAEWVSVPMADWLRSVSGYGKAATILSDVNASSYTL